MEPRLERRPDRTMDPDAAATVILETIPPVMRAIRTQMREAGVAGLSLPQFRALLYVRRHPGTGLSEIAEHVGTTLPATSELVNRLVRQGLVLRATDERERRRICLTLSPLGSAGLDEAQQRTLHWLGGIVAELEPARLQVLTESLTELSDLVRGAEARLEGAPGREDDASRE